ncbi:NAD-dependent epimerase/dehydratase family protein [Cohnella hashimotonis]|uniref:NAD-dependent epimerase/dehydratase family protein n=1 Tax=Cohnella hashimotonis TaxID=2826895 RepID=A0ABT6TKR9_9BACL|nr:NAD-dependent epimerase/dehydratase family protein [Cohnella hashimotonis]
MRYVVIGGSGHVGSYMIPQLVRGGHEVIQVSRGQHRPYWPDPAWREVRSVSADRTTEEAQGTFGRTIAALKPDIVVDMISFHPDGLKQLVEALHGHIQHYLSCGTLWVHGPSVSVPTTEEQPRRPFGEYGIMKARIESWLLDQSRRLGFPATILHPGHIVGPGWEPLNPAGHFDPRIFSRLARGEEVVIPNLGMETVHHVHAEDVAQAFIKASQCWSSAVGNSFHVVSPAALTLRGYAEAVASWFGQEANLKYVPYASMKSAVSEEEASIIWDHIAHSPNASIEKARKLIGYEPRYSSLAAVKESLEWLIEHGKVDVPDAFRL